MARRWIAVAVFLSIVPGLTEGEAPREVLLVRVAAPDPPAAVPHLIRLGLEVVAVDTKAREVVALAEPAQVDVLRHRGWAVEIAQDLTTTDASQRALSDYLDPVEIEQLLDQYVAAHPSLIAKVQYATTEEGRAVWAAKISDNVALEEDEPAILFVAQHHAREVITPEIAMDIIDYLLTHYGSDPKVTRWVDADEIWVLPTHNPDGANFVFTADSNWRKNRRDNGDGTFGVDLNRNYAYRWGACGGSSGNTAEETYRGATPESEPETLPGITELARQQRPVMNLSYHTFGELVIMPFGCGGAHTSENATFRDAASAMATRIVSDDSTSWYAPGTAWELLNPVDGEMSDWFYAELGSFGLSIEANASTQGFQPDYASWRDSTVERNRPGWQYLLDRLEGPSIRGHVTDACTGAPLLAELSLDEVSFVNGESPRAPEPVHGRFQWITLPGDFTLRAALAGYTEQAWPVEVGHAPTDREVRLVPAGSHGLAVRSIVVGDATGDGDGEADPGELVTLTVRLLNTGEALTGVTASLTSDDPAAMVIDGAASYGAVPAGATADGDGFVVQLAGIAQDGRAVALSLVFSADQTLCGDQETVALRVTTGQQICPAIAERLDQDPGWTIDNQGAGGWAFGPPAGDGGATGPSAAPTGNNVYGTNLSGSYGDGGAFALTTGPFDLRGMRHAELRYDRWLDTEPGFDLARVEISVDGGQSWSELWSGFGYGDGWELHRLDVSSLVDQEEDVRFRFRLSSDASNARAGFYVDDLVLCAEQVPGPGGRLEYDGHAIDDADPDGGNGNGVVDAGETVALVVDLRSNRDVPSTGVEAFLSTESPGVTVHTGYATFDDVPAAGQRTSLAPHFSFEVDGTGCGNDITFDLDVRWAGGQAASTFTIPVGAAQVDTVLAHDFETDQGWTKGGDASAGDWEREDPYGVTDPALGAIQPEDDTTPDPGVACWITYNRRPTGQFQPTDGDVDGGAVWLESPVFDATEARRLDLSFSRWFTLKDPGFSDQSSFRVLASPDDGQSWVTIGVLATDASYWTTASYDLAPRLPMTASMKVRFEVNEVTFYGDTLLEGLVDDVGVERERVTCAPWVPPARNAPNGVGDTLRAGKSSTHLTLDWQAAPTDPSHDAASGYRVYRSASPASGFAVASEPTVTFEVCADELLVPDTAFFVLVAENAGGTSGDEPPP